MGEYLIRMPDIGEGIAEAEIADWLVSVGDEIAEDAPICAVMTDKATVEIPSAVAGRVIWLGGAAGEVLAVGSPLIRLEVAGEGNVVPGDPASVAEAPVAENATTDASPQPAPEPVGTPPGPRSDDAPAPVDGKGAWVVKMPDIGEGIAEAEIAEWLVSVGDEVAADAPICAVMTDKATVEIPSPVAGRVLQLGGAVGEKLAVGSELIRLEVEGPGNAAASSVPVAKADDAPAAKAAAAKPDAEPAAKAAAAPAPKPAAPKPAAQPSPHPQGRLRPEGEKPLASPAVRARARAAGIDLRMLRGTGPADRITHDDLDGWIAAGGPLPGAPQGPAKREDVEEIRIIGLRRKIAERMAEAKRHIPHITIVEEVDVTALEDLRAQLNADKSRPKLTLLPFLMKAMTRALTEQPALNAHYDDEAGVVRRYGGVHIGIATQTPGGLMVPVVRHAEALGLWDAATELARVSQAAREGTAARDELSGSTITITSLGALGAIATTPIINRPEVAIVGVNKMVTRPMWDGQGFVPRKVMNLSSSFDHRVIDGWDAAVFVARLKQLLETPALIFVEGAA